MYFVYLDEFGHIGPYIGRSAPKHNESPVFGVAGLILPENSVRPFASYFLEMKKKTFHFELDGSGKMPAKWEKKGTSFIRPASLKKYSEARRALHRIISKVDDLGGHIFYYGREKRKGNDSSLNPIGLYTTCFSHALRRLNKYADERDSGYVVVVDQHSARKDLLECSFKTMFGNDPCKNLASPPFEAESYVNQHVQAADWIATLIGRLAAYEVSPDEFEDYEYIKNIFSEKVYKTRRNSIIEKRPRERIASKQTNGPFSGLQDLLDAKRK